MGALNSLPGFLPKTSDGYGHGVQLLIKCADSVQIDIVLHKECPSYAPLECCDIDL